MQSPDFTIAFERVNHFYSSSSWRAACLVAFLTHLLLLFLSFDFMVLRYSYSPCLRLEWWQIICCWPSEDKLSSYSWCWLQWEKSGCINNEPAWMTIFLWLELSNWWKLSFIFGFFLLFLDFKMKTFKHVREEEDHYPPFPKQLKMDDFYFLPSSQTHQC